jgi:hypothetical protein
MKDWLEKLREESLRPDIDEIPKGYYCAVEAAKRVNLGRAATKRMLNKGANSGKVVELRLRRPTKSGGICVVSYYGPK